MPWTFATKTETVSCNNQTYCSKYWHHPLDHQPCRLTTVNTDTIRCTISLVALLQQILAPSIGTVEPVFAKAGGIQQILAPSAVPPALVNTGTIHCTTSLTAANTGSIHSRVKINTVEEEQQKGRAAVLTVVSSLGSVSCGRHIVPSPHRLQRAKASSTSSTARHATAWFHSLYLQCVM